MPTLFTANTVDRFFRGEPKYLLLISTSSRTGTDWKSWPEAGSPRKTTVVLLRVDSA